MFCDVKPGAEHVMVAPSSTAFASSAADTVTVCGVFQVDGVKVRLVGEFVTPEDPELRDTATVTFEAGAIASRTVKEALEASLTLRLVVDGRMVCDPVPT
jgi:hypothetical protein